MKLKYLFLLLFLCLFSIIGCSSDDGKIVLELEEKYTEITTLYSKSVTENINFVLNDNDIAIIYESSNDEVIDNKGNVNRQDEDVVVGIKITLTKGEFSFSRDYYFVVIALEKVDDKLDETVITCNNELVDISVSASETKYSPDYYNEIKSLVTSYMIKIQSATSSTEALAYLAEVKEMIDLITIKNDSEKELNELSLKLDEDDDDYDKINNLINQALDGIKNSNDISNALVILTECKKTIEDIKSIREATKELNNIYQTIDEKIYSKENCDLIKKLIDEATVYLDTVTDVNECLTYINEIKEQISQVETLKGALTKSILAAITELDELLNEYDVSEYTIDNYQKILNTIETGKEEVKNSNSEDEIMYAINKATVNAFKVETILETLNKAIENGSESLIAQFNAISQAMYTQEDYQTISDIFDEALDNIETLTTVEAVKELLNKVKSDVSLIKITISEAEINRRIGLIEDDLAEITSLANKTIKNDLNLKTSSLYESSIVWEISNLNVISQTGKLASNINNATVNLSYTIFMNDKEYDGESFNVIVNTTNITVNLPAYYNAIDENASSSVLRLALRNLITSTHKKILNYDDLKSKTAMTDADPNRTGYIILFYSRVSVKASWDGGKTWNREHVWPQSKGWFTTSKAGADIHHLRPTNPSINSSRGNKPFAESTTGPYFGAPDVCKGDIARIIFYLLIRYPESDSYSITQVAQSMSMLLKWNEQDPVDSFERNRNETAYNIQGNRNPFIDNADFANDIWGTTKLSFYDALKEKAVEVVIVYADIIAIVDYENKIKL